MGCMQQSACTVAKNGSVPSKKHSSKIFKNEKHWGVYLPLLFTIAVFEPGTQMCKSHGQPHEKHLCKMWLIMAVPMMIVMTDCFWTIQVISDCCCCKKYRCPDLVVMLDQSNNVHAVFTKSAVFVTLYSSGCVGSCANFSKMRNTGVWSLLACIQNWGTAGQ